MIYLSGSSMLAVCFPGAKHGRRAAWIGASGDQTFLRIDELLINAHTLSKSTIIANSSCLGLIVTAEDSSNNMNSLMISRSDGSCRNFTEKNQASLAGQALCLDPVYDVLWRSEFDISKRRIVFFT